MQTCKYGIRWADHPAGACLDAAVADVAGTRKRWWEARSDDGRLIIPYSNVEEAEEFAATRPHITVAEVRRPAPPASTDDAEALRALDAICDRHSLGCWVGRLAALGGNPVQYVVSIAGIQRQKPCESRALAICRAIMAAAEHLGGADHE